MLLSPCSETKIECAAKPPGVGDAVGAGVGVAVGRGVGVGDGVAVGREVGVAVGLGAVVLIGVGLGVGVAVGARGAGVAVPPEPLQAANAAVSSTAAGTKRTTARTSDDPRVRWRIRYLLQLPRCNSSV